MPKEMKQRIIDFPIAKPAPAMRPKRTTTTRQRLEIVYTLDGGATSYALSLQPGDAVLWWLRQDWDDDPPATHIVHIEQGGATVANTFAPLPSGWGGYVWDMVGTTTWDATGSEYVANDLICVVFDQLTGFTAGAYDLVFDLPATPRARVEKALILRGVDSSDPGAVVQYTTSNARRTYDSSGTRTYDGYPATLTLSAPDSLIVMLWGATNGKGYNTVPGTELVSYVYTDPSAPETFTQSRASRSAVVSTSTYSIAAPDENGGPGSYVGCSYYTTAIVINGQ